MLTKLFIATIIVTESRVELGKSASATLGIIQTKAQYFLSSYKPQPLKIANSSCIVGRVTLPVKQKSSFG